MNEIEIAIAFYRRLLSDSSVESHRKRIIAQLHELHLLNSIAHAQKQAQGIAAGFARQATATSANQ